MFGSEAFRQALLEIHCTVEVTGVDSSNQNGKPENLIHQVTKIVHQLLFAGGANVELWCFAIIYGMLLRNLRPSTSDSMCSHERLHGTPGNIAPLRIFNSTIHVMDRRVSRRRGDNITVRGSFVGFQGSFMVYVWLDETKKLHYSRHAVIDELQLDKLPQDRNPAARLLANDPIGANARSQLLDEIAELQVTSDRWVDNKLLQVHIPQVHKLLTMRKLGSSSTMTLNCVVAKSAM